MQRRVAVLADNPQFIHFAALLKHVGGSFEFTSENTNVLPDGAAIVFEASSFYDDSPMTARVVDENGETINEA